MWETRWFGGSLYLSVVRGNIDIKSKVSDSTIAACCVLINFHISPSLRMFVVVNRHLRTNAKREDIDLVAAK